MPEMYAVEIADGEDAAAPGRAVVRRPFGWTPEGGDRSGA